MVRFYLEKVISQFTPVYGLYQKGAMTFYTFTQLYGLYPTGERVIIVMGAVNVMKPRVSGTLNKYILCIA